MTVFKHPGMIHEGSEGHQGGTSNLAGPTLEATTKMGPKPRRRWELTLGESLDQGNAAARRLGLVLSDPISRAVGETEAALHAPVRELGELCSCDLVLHEEW